jgi:beta-glucosidase
MRPLARKLVLVLVSGRPLILGQALQKSDAIVAAWLPGSEGAGVADVLFGDAPFTGKLPYAWPKDAAGVKPASLDSAERRKGLLFEAGYGLSK